ncbi:MAG: TAXI family TRAP transporter solute-binding subunit [Alphaproteobacteria bacterium]|nr:TAXI family TRAP transporter solute-binding subunit [Alphaproteobacteria bacterium]
MIRVSAAAAAMGLACLVSGPAAAQQQVRLMTGPQGGVWVPMGGAFKALWEKAVPGLAVQTLPGAGIANVRGVDEDKAEAGFGNSITSVDGVNGLAPFPKKTTKVCQLANLYPQYFQVVVLANSGINGLKDLKGKSIAIQPRGNTAELITQHVLQIAGMTYGDVKASFVASYTDAASLLKDGHAQAFTLGTTIPASSVMDVASGRDIKLIGVSAEDVAAMKKINAGYGKVAVPADTYPKQGKPVDVIGYSAHLVVSCALPAEMVYAMTKSIADNVKDLAPINKAVESLTPKMMAEDIGVPFHPGAAKFYKEKGAM